LLKGRVVTNELCKMGEGLLYHYTRPKVGQKKIAVLDGLNLTNLKHSGLTRGNMKMNRQF
ncbi:MAG: hypothetical protein D3922_03730, partial [Candidatus Electrothrix sp. AR1]|nr:hypothetical protein [Candidatus Electrothrix sp. AR1]